MLDGVKCERGDNTCGSLEKWTQHNYVVVEFGMVGLDRPTSLPINCLTKQHLARLLEHTAMSHQLKEYRFSNMEVFVRGNCLTFESGSGHEEQLQPLPENVVFDERRQLRNAEDGIPP